MARTHSFTPEGRAGAALAVVCDSLDDLATWLNDGRRVVRSYWGYSAEAKRHLLTGDDRLVTRAEALLSMIEAESPIDNSARENIRAVSGGLADVPAYLAGTPVNMRRRVRVETPAPLRIVLDVTSSAMVNNATLERRGVASLALTRKLIAAGHAVELWVCEAVGRATGGFCMVHMDTQPLDLSRACWALASAEFSREVAFTGCNTVLGEAVGGWPWDNVKWTGHPEAQQAAYAMALGVDTDSLIAMPSLYSDSSAAPFRSDAAAVKWVNETYVKAVAQSLHGQA